MKISFLWDTAFLKWSENIIFDNIKNKIIDSKIILSLESIFEEKGKNYINIKNKISLKQWENKISLLKEINPFLVNTSNNHSNDYWNDWAIEKPSHNCLEENSCGLHCSPLSGK